MADIKYVTDDGFGREADSYQLLAYTTALELPEGLLTFARTKEAHPREIKVRNRGARLRTWAIRLDRTLTMRRMNCGCWPTTSPHVLDPDWLDDRL